MITVSELLHGVLRADKTHRASRQAFVERIIERLAAVEITSQIARTHARLWDLFLAGSQGLALAIASGALFGSAGLRGNPGAIPLVAAVVLGAFLYGASLTPEDHPASPGWVVGAPVAFLAYLTARDIAAVASGRAGAGGAGGVALFIVLFALALAGLSLLGPVALIGIPALIALIYLFAVRRRRASEKHAGLRILR